jgi:hypothetical protein
LRLGDEPHVGFLAGLELGEVLAVNRPFARDGQGEDEKGGAVGLNQRVGIALVGVANELGIDGGQRRGFGEVTEAEAEPKGVGAAVALLAGIELVDEPHRREAEFGGKDFEICQAEGRTEGNDVGGEDGRQGSGSEAGDLGWGRGRTRSGTQRDAAGGEHPEQGEGQGAGVAGEQPAKRVTRGWWGGGSVWAVGGCGGRTRLGGKGRQWLILRVGRAGQVYDRDEFEDHAARIGQ